MFLKTSLQHFRWMLVVLWMVPVIHIQAQNSPRISSDKVLQKATRFARENRLVSLRDDDQRVVDSIGYYHEVFGTLSFSEQEKKTFGNTLKVIDFYHDLVVKSDHSMAAYEKGLEFFEEKYSNDLIAYRMRLGLVVLGMRLHMGKKDERLMQLIKNAESYQDTHEVDPVDKGYLYYNVGLYYYELKAYEKAASYFDRLEGSYYAGVKVSLKILYHFTVKEYDIGLQYYQENIDNPNLTQEDVYDIKAQMASALIKIRRYQVAVDLFEDAIDYLEDAETFNSILLKYKMGIVYLGIEDYQKAEKVLGYLVKNDLVKKQVPQAYDYSLIGLLEVFVKLGKVDPFDLLMSEVDRLKEQYTTKSSSGIKIRLLFIEHLFNKGVYNEAYDDMKALEPAFEEARNGEIHQQKSYPIMAKICLRLGKVEEFETYTQAFNKSLQKNYEEELKKGELTQELLSSNYERKIELQKSEIQQIQRQMNQEKRSKRLTAFVFGVILILLCYFTYRGRERFKAIFAKIRKENKETTTLLKEREKLLGIVAHQSKAPFVNMKYMVQMTENIKDMSEEEVLFVTSNVKKLLENIDIQINDVLNWVKILLQDRIEKRIVHVREVAAELEEEYQFYAKDQQVAIHNNIPPHIILNTNRNALKTILSNLLLNAVKYSHPKSMISVCFHQNTIVVKDGADPISDEMKKVILSDHQPLPSNTKNIDKKLPSSGLGLYIVMDLCTKLDYRLDIQTQESNSFILKL